MPTATRSKRRIWTVEEWKSFTARCRPVMTGLYELATKDVKDTVGLKAIHVRPLVEAHSLFKHGMIGLESLMEDHIPHVVCSGKWPEETAWSLIFHEGGRDENTGMLVFLGGRVRKSAPKLTREEWTAIGQKAKPLAREIQTLGIELQEAQGCSREKVNRFFKAHDRLMKAFCKLDDLVCAQHPDWPEAIRVFYGSN